MAVENDASKRTNNNGFGPVPAPEGYDVDWPTKIAKAKKARKSGQKARRGKPVAFEAPTLGPR